jgi:hypothetical protein
MKSNEIAVAHTPEGGWRGEMPPPVLAECDEALVAGAPDLRGVWRAYRVERDGAVLDDHPLMGSVQRIEQCGDRVVITAGRIIHDMRADGSLEHGVDDVAEMDLRTRIRVAAVFRDGRLDLHPGGVVEGRPALVTREIVDGEMVWQYAMFAVRCRRIEHGQA